MKLTENTKKRLTLAGLGVVCVILVIGIASQFKTEDSKEAEVQLPPTATNTVAPSVSVSKATVTLTPTPKVSVQPITPTESVSQVTDTVDSVGTDQSIQKEVTKPAEPLNKRKKNPSKKPDRQKVTKSDSDKSSSSSSKSTSTLTTSTPKSGDKNSKSRVWVPGFGWVDDEGTNQGRSVDGEGDINKQVGNMD